MKKGPAYRIHTERLVIRCWDPSDAPLMKRAIEESFEHLRPWMPWVNSEPEDVETKVERIRTMRGRFDLGQDFIYGIFTEDEREVVGGTGLHTRVGRGALEIGYWIHANHVKRGFATEASAALIKVGFELHQIDRIEIHCDPANVASAAVPRKLGFNHEATLRQRTLVPDGSRRDEMIWTLLREEFVKSPIAACELKAFDVLGRRVI